MVVSSSPINISGGALPSHLHDSSSWSRVRKHAMNSSIFKDGKIWVKALGPNEILGDESKGEVCLSSFGWIHSFCY